MLYWFGDKIIISIFEIAILIFLIFAIIKDNIIKRKRGVKLTVIRGDISWRNLTYAFGTLSLLSMQIVELAEFLKGYKVIVNLFNQIVFSYLCYGNNWLRNKIIGLYSKLRTEK